MNFWIRVNATLALMMFMIWLGNLRTNQGSMQCSP